MAIVPLAAVSLVNTAKAGGPVVFHDTRVLHRNVRRLLLELAHRIATGSQRLIHKLIGRSHGSPGIVDRVSFASKRASSQIRVTATWSGWASMGYGTKSQSGR